MVGIGAFLVLTLSLLGYSLLAQPKYGEIPESIVREVDRFKPNLANLTPLEKALELQRFFFSKFSYRKGENKGIPLDMDRSVTSYIKSESFECHDNLAFMISLFRRFGLNVYPGMVFEGDFFDARWGVVPTRSHAVILLYTDTARPEIVAVVDTVSSGLVVDGAIIGDVHPILKAKHLIVPGLLSRHGRFYAPYWIPIDFDLSIMRTLF